ncbi:putative sucrose-phosphate synthase 2 [Cinnamomum micranthum f. kanehirae]|uniref:Putative sucrose-phosphate synthase 2 n=1 Tax=Cinnamomum micranthum f. kanehirae TaxID=337451 RepID=A0A3S3QAE0_9MAGN|nr:putative sucrose-phosphate synthase 2 [Cinnamomum micranthum f. kanehirae]
MRGSEELGVDLLGPRPRDSLVSVPIKKRKCYFIRSPSPPPKKDEPPISELETPVLGISQADRNANLSNEKPIGLTLQHSDFSFTSSSKVELACKGKVNSEGGSTSRQVAANSGFFSQKEPFGQSIVEETIEGKPIMDNKSAFIGVSGNTELLSALEEPPRLRIEGQNVGGSCPKQEKLYQSPQVLVESCFDIHCGKLNDPTVSEEQDNVQTKGKLIKSEADRTDLHEQRSRWDLNTTMDNWEGSSSRDLSLNPAADGMNVLGPSQIYDIKPFLCSKEMQDSNIASRKFIHDGSKDSKRSFDFLSRFNQEAACSYTKQTLMNGGLDGSTSEKVMLTGITPFVECKPIKSEQFELGGRGDFKTVECCNQIIYLRTPKAEASDGISQEWDVAGKNLMSKNPGGIKVEPVEGSSEVCLNAAEGSPHLPDIHKLTPELPVSGEVAQKASETVFRASDLVPDTTESVVTQHTLDASQRMCSEVAYDVVHVDSAAVSGAAESDDEKINLFADIHEDDTDGSVTESDNSPNVGTVKRQTNDNNNDDDFEDGEVREPLLNDTAVEGICREGEMGRVSKGNLDNKEGCGDPGDSGVLISSKAEYAESATKNPMETISAPCTGGDDSALCIKKKEQCSSTDPSLKKSSATAGSTAASGKKRSIKIIKKAPSGFSEQKKQGSGGLETTSDQAVSATTSHETITDDGKENNTRKQDGIDSSSDMGRVNDSNLSKTDPSARVDEATRIDRSRFFNLSKASNGLSPGRMRSIHDVPKVLQTESVRTSHTSVRVDELHPRGTRDESCMDGNRKFVRGRNLDHLTGNSGPDYMHKKRRVDNSLETLRFDQDSGHDFASRNYSDSSGARFPRPRNNVAAPQRGGPAIPPDGNLVTSGKAWRKHIHDELESSCHLPFRRRSPCGREGPIALGGARVVQRPPRVISPDRCINRGRPDMVLVRREEKFMRDMPDDMMNPLLSHSRPEYQQVHDPFIRRESRFSPGQRHDYVRVPRICSKSPPRSRTRSPPSWPSPSRSPDLFNGHPEQLLRRSPPVFRGERMRSPHQRPCFADAVMVRRPGSPPRIPHLPGEMRKIGPSRPFVLTRSPSGRILQRSTRRFNMIDSQERVVENDEYFEPMQSDLIHEFVGDDCVSDRRKFRERIEPQPIRTFRPHDEGVDVERFSYHEDGSRPYRFRPEDDGEFHNRNNPREFEERIGNRLGNPRRPRNLEEKQNDRFRGPAEWGEASFNDAARQRRGRF